MKSKDLAGTSAPPVLLMLVERFSPDLGGVSRSASRTAAAIARLGWQVHVVAWTKSLPPGAVDDTDTAEGVAVHRVGMFSNWDYSMQHTMNVLEWLHEKLVFDAVWGHYLFPAGYLAVVFARAMRLPSTVSARGNDIDRLMFPPGDFARLIWTLERANSVSCVSADLARKVNVLLEDEIEVAVLPNVVDATIFRPGAMSRSSLRATLGIQPEDSVLGFCGELRHKKGAPFVLSALVHVCQNRKARLLVIGEVRPGEQAHLAAFAAQHPEVVDRIIVTGHLEDSQSVADHLNVCDVILQPSVWDGLPNSVLEAMACSRIVIASDAGGIPEAVIHGVNGFAIRKAALNNLGTAVLEVLNLPDHKRAAIEASARETVLMRFHAQGEANRLQLLLSRLVTGRDSSVS